jgi:hypothetical protein
MTNLLTNTLVLAWALVNGEIEVSFQGKFDCKYILQAKAGTNWFGRDYAEPYDDGPIKLYDLVRPGRSEIYRVLELKKR